MGLALWFRPSPRALETGAEWLAGRGLSGALLLGGVYALGTVLLVPGSALTLLTGFVYGPAGVAVVWPAAVLGAAGGFGLGRTLFRGAAERIIRGSPRLAAVDRALDTGAFRLVLLLRLSPLVPFGALNYALGASPVRFWTFLAASALGIVPGTVLYVLLGSAAPTVAGALTGSSVGSSVAARVFLGIGLLATALATWLLARGARRALKTRLPPDAATRR